MDREVWRSFDKTFDTHRFLYHYTHFTNAIKILYSEKLIFSPLTKMNDTSEYKSRLSVDFSTAKTLQDKATAKTMLEEITEYIDANAKYIRLLCCSVDSKYNSDCEKIPSWEENERYYYITGRGCALGSMWAHYASKNEGVCLIFDKKKLLQEVKSKTEYHREGLVNYREYFSPYVMNFENLKILHGKIKDPTSDKLPIAALFKDRNKNSLIQLNYFEKLKNWQSENEFRILALAGNDKEFAINNLYNYLEGVVVGEKTDPAFTNVLRNELKEKNIEVKGIEFDNLKCRFKR